MSMIQVFEPALCCSTGVCGQDVDQALVTFSADMDWVGRQGGQIARFNLASEPMAFAQNDAVRRLLQVAGSDGLPLVLVDGVTVLTGAYPDRAQLAAWAGLDVLASPELAAAPAGVGLLTITETSACCADGTGCC